MQAVVLLTILLCIIYSVKSQEPERRIYMLEEPQSRDDTQGGFSTHIVALRPDYTFWKMVNVLKTMFDSSRTTEKRRPRDAEDLPATELPNLRSRRLFLNFGRFRV
uniref:Uncharacterized protein n=1 Tax=Caenorhabditis japonica TaxID=281687 RepID=A0A2Q4SKT9_CAEJA